MSNETFTPRQLTAARKALWHQDGNALLTQGSAREWLELAGLIPYMPHTEQMPAPAPSFVEAILGRPETGHRVPYLAPEETEQGTGNREQGTAGDEAIASDPEVMTDAEEEAEEDQGDEIALVDRIHAEIHAEAEAPAVEAQKPAPKPVMEIVNGFTPKQMEEARRMLARLVADGSAVPLNLLGGPGEVPDFVCSAQTFSFVYTLRGDKGWKLPPATFGAGRVSQLALHAWEILKEKGAMTAFDLVPELGREVTQVAVQRALSELWAVQRVIPLPQVDGGATVWELVTGKFVRHLKAGSNAGQPTAISALLSLYLGQVVAASTEEIEVFLSPLAARSRIREIVGGLSATRQLEETVHEGKTLHSIAGELPEFPDVEEPVLAPAAPMVSRYEQGAGNREQGTAGRGARRDKVVYPVRKPAGARAATEGNFANRRTTVGGDRERRPFVKREGTGSRDSGPARPYVKREGAAGAYSKPWNDDRPARKPYEGTGNREQGTGRPYTPRSSEGGERKPYERKSFGGDRPAYGRSAGAEGGERKPYERKPYQGTESREQGTARPYTPRTSDGGERRPYTPRGEGAPRPYASRSAEGGERKPYERKSFGDRKPFTPREGGGERRPYTPRTSEGGERRPYTPRAEGAPRSYAPRSSEGGDRKPYERKSFGDRKPFTPREGGAERRPYTPRTSEGGERRPYAPREGGSSRPYTPRASEGGERKPYERKSFGDRKPYQGAGNREQGTARPFTPRGDGERTPYTRKPFTPREGGDGEKKPYVKKAYGPAADRSPKAFGERKSARKPGGKPPAKGGWSMKSSPKRRPE